MAEYIEREAAVKAIEEVVSAMETWISDYQAQRRGLMTAINIVEDIPAADVRPVVRGKWKYKEGGELCADGYYCTACGTGFHVHVPYFAEFNFCPNCGADMRPEPPKEEV